MEDQSELVARRRRTFFTNYLMLLHTFKFFSQTGWTPDGADAENKRSREQRAGGVGA